VDTALYGRLGQETAGRTRLEQFVVPIRTGKAWRVQAGDIYRIVTIEGPQVGDLNPLQGAIPRSLLRTRAMFSSV
jgi:hypothetical protein